MATKRAYWPNPSTGMSAATRVGDHVYVAGQVAYNTAGELIGEDDALAQAEQCFDNIEAVLSSCGLALSDVVAVSAYVARRELLADYVAVRTRRFSHEHPPASTTVVAELALPELLVEVTVVAVVGGWTVNSHD
jgi:enamine deaminase RidA (YjgF/YER057c/UK114 family)